MRICSRRVYSPDGPSLRSGAGKTSSVASLRRVEREVWGGDGDGLTEHSGAIVTREDGRDRHSCEQFWTLCAAPGDPD